MSYVHISVCVIYIYIYIYISCSHRLHVTDCVSLHLKPHMKKKHDFHVLIPVDRGSKTSMIFKSICYYWIFKKNYFFISN